MLVSEIIQDCLIRLPVEVLQKGGEPYILREINRYYKSLNQELECLEKPLTVTEDDGGYNLPVDYIRTFKILKSDGSADVDLVYRHPEVFDNQEDNTWMIANKKIYFANEDDSTERTFWYYSSGLSMVNKATADLGTGEINEPEWINESLHSILIHGVCPRLSKSYELLELDLAETLRLKMLLKETNYRKDATQAVRSVPHGRKNKYIDDYERETTLDQ